MEMDRKDFWKCVVMVLMLLGKDQRTVWSIVKENYSGVGRGWSFIPLSLQHTGFFFFPKKGIEKVR